MKVYNNILESIGNTPLIKLNKMTLGLSASIYVKCEFFNPGGSVKDRIGVNLIEDAEKRGILHPGDVIVEPTSGNTGMGLAQAAIVKGYKIIFTIPDKMSREKIDLLRAFGAKVIITPTAVPPNHPSNYVKMAERITRETPHAVMLNQFYNMANPAAHYKTTGPEIWEQTEGKLDILVASMGTGGTISGTAKYLKEKNPNIYVVGVDPEGSMYHHEFYCTKGKTQTYKVEGIGEDFMPATLNLDLVDEIITAGDMEAFSTARSLLRDEGIFAGGSAGIAVYAALQVARRFKEEITIAVILPDSGRNYLNKFYSDEWMVENGFFETSEMGLHVAEILRVKRKAIPEVIAVSPDDSLECAIEKMRLYSISQLPVIERGTSIGSIQELTLLRKLVAKEISMHEKVSRVMDDPLPMVRKSDTIVSPGLLLKNRSAIIVEEKHQIIDIITPADIIHYLANQ